MSRATRIHLPRNNHYMVERVLYVAPEKLTVGQLTILRNNPRLNDRYNARWRVAF